MSYAIELPGLDGSNSLGFLAALGTLRTVATAWPKHGIRMSWRGLQPELHSDVEATPDGIIEAICLELHGSQEHPAFGLDKNLEVPPGQFRLFAQSAAAAAAPPDRAWADFAAAFGCDAVAGEKNREIVILDTALRTMSGTGHQHFLGSIRNIAQNTKGEHIRKALFEPWRYDDPVEKLTMRWDPVDDQRYALRWHNPSGDKTRRQRGSVLGGNRLAIEGMSLLPTMPTGRTLATTGFTGRHARDTFWTWPIWNRAVSLDVVRSLLAMRELQVDEPPRDHLLKLGVVEIYRAQRLTIGKYRNFAPAQPV